MSVLKIKTLLTAAALLLIISCGSGDIPEGLSMEDWTGARLATAVGKGGMKGGLSAMVYRDGEILYSGAEGMADREAGWEIDGTTPMPVGSISKIFTSVAIMQLVEEGLLELDEPAGTYLPRLKLEGGYERKFTVRHLMTHHSGIQGDLFYNWFEDDKEVLYDMLSERPMAAEPGRLFSYANIGFSLLGLIIEEVSGIPYERYIEERIFIPARMENSYASALEATERLPQGYRGKSHIPVPALRDVPAGGLLVSADDMGRFISSLYGSASILKRDSLKEMITVQNGDNPVDRDFEIGLGFWLIDPFGTKETLASHGGDLPPFHSILITIPGRDLAVFVATNDDGKGGTLAIETGIALMEELMSREGLAFGSSDDSPERLPVSPSDRERFSGIYGTTAGLIELEPFGDHLKMKLGRMTMHLEKKTSGRFGVEMKLFNVIPLPVSQLSVLEVDLYEADGDRWMGLWMKGIYLGAGSRLPDVSYEEDFARFAGAYKTPGRSNVLEDGFAAIDEIRLSEKGGRYVLSLKLLGQKVDMALRPDGPGRALTDGTGRGLGDLVLFETTESGRTLMKWSGFTLEKEN